MTYHKYERGTQVIKLPPSTQGETSHPDTEYGFITSGPTSDGSYFVRYWSKSDPDDLRTKASSELTPWLYLSLGDSHTPEQVQKMLKEYC